MYGTNPYIIGDVDTWDSKVIDGLDANLFDPEKDARWEAYNTYTRYDDDSNIGLMGYYQTDTDYPEILPCEDDHEDGYWGRDWLGTLIEPGNPIRHHRLPLPAGDEISDGNYERRLGIRFTMSEEYPHASIVGHYYVAGDHATEKTVLDKGILTPIGSDRRLDVEPTTKFAYVVANESHHLPSSRPTVLPGEDRFEIPLYGYVSNTTLFKESFPTAAYLRLEKHYTNPVIDDDEAIGGVAGALDTIVYGDRVSVIQHSPWINPEEFNYKIEFQSILPKSIAYDGAYSVPNSVDTGDTAFSTVVNLSVNSTIGIIKLDREVTEVAAHALTTGPLWDYNTFFQDGNGLGVTLKADIVVFRNLNAIQYRRIGSRIHRKEEDETHVTTLYAGDTFLAPLEVLDYTWFLNDDDDPTIRGDYVNV